VERERDESGWTAPQAEESGPPFASPATLAAALDAMPLPALVLARGGALAFANRALLAATGHCAGDLVQREAALALGASDDDRARLREASAELDAGRPWVGEVAFRHAGGGAWALELRASPLVGPGGAVTHAVALCHDLAERRQSQARLLLTDRMVSVGTLAAGVAHEINNPLAFLLTNLGYATDALAGELPLERLREVREAIAEALEGAQRVREIVRDLKTFSRSDDGGRAPVSVERVLESSIKMAWNEIRHRARLVKHFGGVPSVLAEEAKLGQVFLNLLLNAVQAIPEGDARGNVIEVTTAVEAGAVVVTVRDSGSGIPEAVRPRLFTPFYTTKPPGVGTGLGLYICRDIVGGLGGTIEALPCDGPGAVLRVTLPLHAEAAPPAPCPAPAARRGRVLVVDDEPMIGATLSRVLGGHEVVTVGSARAALARLEAGEVFDVVLCDLMMPEMTGMDLYDALAARTPALAERVVFLSGGLFTPAARSFAERVKNPLLEKPFDAVALRRVVTERMAAVARPAEPA
jgi:PAS domain S-box-containing protein